MKKLSSLNKIQDVHHYASFFRVAICILLLLDFAYSYGANKYIFSDDFPTFLKSSNFFNIINAHHALVFFLYILSILIYLFGITHYFGALFFIIMYVIVSLMLNNMATWGEEILLYTLFYFSFVNSYNHYTLFKKKIQLNSAIKFISLIGLVSIILHVFYIYGINVYHKIQGKSWQYGNAISIGIIIKEHVVIFPIFLKLSSSKVFSQIISYVVIFQQLLFIPLAIINKTRPYIVLISILTHIGIAIIFLFVKFQIIVILMLFFVLYIPTIKKELILALKK